MSNVRLLSISSSLTTDCVLCEGESCDSSMTLRFMTYGTGGEKNRKVMWCALSCKTDSYDSEIMRWLIWGPGNDHSHENKSPLIPSTHAKSDSLHPISCFHSFSTARENCYMQWTVKAYHSLCENDQIHMCWIGFGLKNQTAKIQSYQEA